MKRAQAALEFLTTYGWAFLVILVMIGALAYFGVLNPSGVLPSRCIFGPEIQCIEHRIIGNQGGNGLVSLRARNNVGQMADFNFGATEISTGRSAGSCTSLASVRAGRIMEINCTFTAYTFAAGDKMKFEINATYMKAGGTYPMPVKGEVYGEVQ